MIYRSVRVNQVSGRTVLSAVQGVFTPLLAVGDQGDKEKKGQGEEETGRRYDCKTVRL